MADLDAIVPIYQYIWVIQTEEMFKEKYVANNV